MAQARSKNRPGRYARPKAQAGAANRPVRPETPVCSEDCHLWAVGSDRCICGALRSEDSNEDPDLEINYEVYCPLCDHMDEISESEKKATAIGDPWYCSSCREQSYVVNLNPIELDVVPPGEVRQTKIDDDFTIALKSLIEEDGQGGLVSVHPRQSRAYRWHLGIMRGLGYEERVREVERVFSLAKDSEEWMRRVFLRWDVRFSPDYWLDLKSQAAARRDRHAKKLLDRVEKAFRPYHVGRAGRPRKIVDRGAEELLKIKILDDLPCVARLVENHLPEIDPMTEPPADLLEAVRAFAAVNGGTVSPGATTKFLKNLCKRKVLKPKGMATAILYWKWRHHPEGMPGLHEREVAKYVPRAIWQQVYRKSN